MGVAASRSLGAGVLTGAIPTELGLLNAMSSLWLQLNSLSGTIPSQIGSLTALGEYHDDAISSFVWATNSQFGRDVCDRGKFVV